MLTNWLSPFLLVIFMVSTELSSGLIPGQDSGSDEVDADRLDPGTIQVTCRTQFSVNMKKLAGRFGALKKDAMADVTALRAWGQQRANLQTELYQLVAAYRPHMTFFMTWVVLLNSVTVVTTVGDGFMSAFWVYIVAWDLVFNLFLTVFIFRPLRELVVAYDKVNANLKAAHIEKVRVAVRKEHSRNKVHDLVRTIFDEKELAELDACDEAENWCSQPAFPMSMTVLGKEVTMTVVNLDRWYKAQIVTTSVRCQPCIHESQIRRQSNHNPACEVVTEPPQKRALHTTHAHDIERKKRNTSSAFRLCARVQIPVVRSLLALFAGLAQLIVRHQLGMVCFALLARC